MKTLFKTIAPLIIALLVSVTSLMSIAEGQRTIRVENDNSGTPQVKRTLNDSTLQAATERTADTLVISPGVFHTALRPWIDYRGRQGHRIMVITPTATAYGIKQQIRRVAAHGNLKNVVLIGDAPSADPRSMLRAVPTDYIPAKVIAKFGPELEIATDNTFADIDDDGLPDLSIGRMTVDSVPALQQQIRKIINYEASSGGEWQRRINLVAGTGGFGQLSDSVIEQTSRRLISDLIPPEYSTTMTYANWSSAYCPDPRQFIPVTLNRLNEGSLFWVYMGHGHPNRLDYVRTPIGGFPMFRDRDVAAINCDKGQPIALMLSCYTGAFDFPKDCLAEKMVNQPGGPIASICGSRVTMPAGMSLLSVGLIEEYFSGDKQTLGEIFMAAKRKLVVKDATAVQPQAMPVDSDDQDSRFRDTIELLGKTLSPSGEDLNLEAMEHVHLFHLLGDPLLRVKRPQEIELAVEPSEDHSTLTVTGQSPIAGTMVVELVYSRDRFHKRPPRRPEFKWDDASLDDYRNVYERSNQRTVTAKRLEVPAGEFSVEMQVPDWAKGRCVVRGYLQQPEQKRYALGASELRIKRR